MRAVLGIDAAWTLTQPSGVAVVAESSARWRLVGVAPSYQRFHCLADPARQAELRPSGSQANAVQLISSASRLCGGTIDLIAVDMPFARTPITGRRVSDNAVSIAYGARQCGTHTPNALRPGPVSVTLRDGFAATGYPLMTSSLASRGVIEIYPHAALVEWRALTPGFRTRSRESGIIGPVLRHPSGANVCFWNGTRLSIYWNEKLQVCARP